MKPVIGCEECEFILELGGEEACIECRLYAQPEETQPENEELNQ